MVVDLDSLHFGGYFKGHIMHLFIFHKGKNWIDTVSSLLLRSQAEKHTDKHTNEV